jgi:hypothetical protein
MQDFYRVLAGYEDQAAECVMFTLKDRLGDQRGGSEWEPIKILLKGDWNSDKMN